MNEIIRARNVSERDRRLKTEDGDIDCRWSRERVERWEWRGGCSHQNREELLTKKWIQQHPVMKKPSDSGRCRLRRSISDSGKHGQLVAVEVATLKASAMR